METSNFIALSRYFIRFIIKICCLASGTSWRSLIYYYNFNYNFGDYDEANSETIKLFKVIVLNTGNTTKNDILLTLNENQSFNSGFYIASVKACVGTICSIYLRTKNRLLNSKSEKTLIFYSRTNGNGDIKNSKTIQNMADSSRKFKIFDLLGRELSYVIDCKFLYFKFNNF